MKLNIANYNPDINEDIQYVDELIEMLNNVKENLTTKCYSPFQKFLTKINKFMDMITPNIQKELDEIDSKKTFFDESDDQNDDNVSIGSISEYEEDIDSTEFDEMQIKSFENETEIKLNESNNRFDFEFDKN
jgi:hypothetical protein